MKKAPTSRPKAPPSGPAKKMPGMIEGIPVEESGSYEPSEPASQTRPPPPPPTRTPTSPSNQSGASDSKPVPPPPKRVPSSGLRRVSTPPSGTPSGAQTPTSNAGEIAPPSRRPPPVRPAPTAEKRDPESSQPTPAPAAAPASAAMDAPSSNAPAKSSSPTPAPKKSIFRPPPSKQASSPPTSPQKPSGGTPAPASPRPTEPPAQQSGIEGGGFVDSSNLPPRAESRSRYEEGQSEKSPERAKVSPPPRSRASTGSPGAAERSTAASQPDQAHNAPASQQGSSTTATQPAAAAPQPKPKAPPPTAKMSTLAVVDDDDDDAFFSDQGSPERGANSKPAPPAKSAPRPEPKTATERREDTKDEPKLLPKPTPKRVTETEPLPSESSVAKKEREEDEREARKEHSAHSSRLSSPKRSTPNRSESAHRRREGSGRKGSERPEMDFSFEPIPDILEIEERERVGKDRYGRQTTLRSRQKPAPRTTMKEINRLAQPKYRVTKPKRKSQEEEMWDNAHEVVEYADEGEDDAHPRSGSSPSPSSPPKRQGSQPDLSHIDSSVWATGHHAGHHSGPVYRASAGPTELGKSPPPARGPKAAIAAAKKEEKQILSNPTDYCFIKIVSAGREERVAIDRKTLLMTLAVDLDLPLGGTFRYHNMPVHAHATTTTLGLRHGPEHSVVLKYSTPVEEEEETARSELIAYQVHRWTAALSQLLVSLSNIDSLPPHAFADASGGFADISYRSPQRIATSRLRMEGEYATSGFGASPLPEPPAARPRAAEDGEEFEDEQRRREIVGFRNTDGRHPRIARKTHERTQWEDLEQYGYTQVPKTSGPGGPASAANRFVDPEPRQPVSSYYPGKVGVASPPRHYEPVDTSSYSAHHRQPEHQQYFSYIDDPWEDVEEVVDDIY